MLFSKIIQNKRNEDLMTSKLLANKELIPSYLNSVTEIHTKIKVIAGICNKNQAVKFSLLLSESVAHIFEEMYPSEKVIRDTISYLKNIQDFNEISDWQLRKIRKYKELVDRVREITIEGAYDPGLGLYLDCDSTDAVCTLSCAITAALYGTPYASEINEREVIGDIIYSAFCNAYGVTGRSINIIEPMYLDFIKKVLIPDNSTGI